MTYLESSSRFSLGLRMIFSENRFPLFGIMRQRLSGTSRGGGPV